MARTTTQRKRRRRARESSAPFASSSESEGWSVGSEDERDEGDKQERRWRLRRSTLDSKGKGKELVKEDEESMCSEGNSEGETAEAAEGEQGEDPERKPKGVISPPEEICGICLSEGGNERGKLDCCDHFFCFACIMEWSKVESRCPMCKQRFVTVMRPAVSGVSRSRTRSFRIPTRDQVYEPSEEEIRLFTDPYQNTVCTECQEAGDEGLLLLCDRCDAAAHTYCVGLGRSVPRGDWFCQACQALELISSEEEEDATFDMSDVEEEEESGTDSFLAMFVREMQPNLFAGRTRRSTTNQRPPLRRSTRRRARRSSLCSSAGRSGSLITMSTIPQQRREYFPAFMETYSARTLSHQRQVQATVQNRLQNMRENWNRYRSGDIQLGSAGQSVESSRFVSMAGGLPSSSTPRLGDIGTSTPGIPMDAEPITSQGAGWSSEPRDVEQAWANMDRASRLEGTPAGSSQQVATNRASSATERRSGEAKSQPTPVSSRTRERSQQGDAMMRTNSSRVSLIERQIQGEISSTANSSRGTIDVRHSQGEDHPKPTITRGGYGFFNGGSSNSRDSDMKDFSRSGLTVRPSENAHTDILSSGAENSRNGYYPRDSNRQHITRTGSNPKDNCLILGIVKNHTSRENRNDSEVLPLRSILDDKDNSRGSGGVSTRSREAKEAQCSQGQGILDKDNSRGSVGVMTRWRETKEAQIAQERGIFDDKDNSNSRASMGPTTRGETDRTQLQSLLQGGGQSRNPSRDGEMKFMKKQCFDLVDTALKPMLSNGSIDKNEFKELARSATHTILSSLGVPGLEHVSDVVAVGTFTCAHEQSSSSLIPGCCVSCVQRQVKRYVKSLVREKILLRSLL